VVSRGDFQSRENTNETVREIMRVDRNVVEDIRKKQLIWYGHVKRMEEERLPKWLLEWHAKGRRRRARPRTTWKQDIVKAMTSTGRRLDEQRTVENFGNRKVLKDATNRIMMISYKFHNRRLDGFFVILLDDYIQS
jgi:hypothetical protein